MEIICVIFLLLKIGIPTLIAIGIAKEIFECICG